MRVESSALPAMAVLSWVVGGGSALAPARAQEAPAISGSDQAAIFKAAGAVRRGSAWVICGDDPTGPQARIEQVQDLNGDGRPEAVVMEDGSFCHGAAGMGYSLLSRQADGSWKQLDSGSGIPEFLAARGAGGWPDISVGGPGFCFPVLRWNGSEYALDRHEYEGKACQAR